MATAPSTAIINKVLALDLTTQSQIEIGGGYVPFPADLAASATVTPIRAIVQINPAANQLSLATYQLAGTGTTAAARAGVYGVLTVPGAYSDGTGGVVCVHGVVEGYLNLIPGAAYYADFTGGATNGLISKVYPPTVSPQGDIIFVGTAITNTALYVNPQSSFSPNRTRAYTTTITGTGAATVFAITHNLLTNFLTVSIRQNTSKAYANPPTDFTYVGTSSNVVTITFAAAPANALVYNVTVIGVTDPTIT